MTSVMRTIYLSYSFGFLLGRTTAVSLTAASVHDESLLPAPVLYGVNGSSYSSEVFAISIYGKIYGRSQTVPSTL